MFFRGPKVDHLLEKVASQLEAGAAEAALATAEEAVRTAPKNADALAALGMALASLDRPEEALDAWEQALARDRKQLQAIFGAADLLVTRFPDDEEALGQGLALCERGIRLARKARDPELAAELQLLAGAALNDLGNPRAAREQLDEAIAVLGPLPEAVLERGIALFESCHFDEAREQFEAILQDNPDEPWAHHYLGLLAERRGDEKEAGARFARAQALSPDDFPVPITLTEAEFDAVVEAALERLPEPVRRYLANVAIAVDKVPADGDLESGDVSPTVLGLFRGSPLAEKASMDPWAHFPSSIVLYQRNLERFAHDREDLIEQIDVTLLHEVGHFLGFDEDDLAERGLD